MFKNGLLLAVEKYSVKSGISVQHIQSVAIFSVKYSVYCDIAIKNIQSEAIFQCKIFYIYVYVCPSQAWTFSPTTRRPPHVQRGRF
jgi:hypothetical protein